MRTTLWLALIAVVLAACSSSPEVPPELERAASIVEDALKTTSLEQSSYAVVLPNGTPKQFVSWYFSTLGTAEWPPREDSPYEADYPGVKIPAGVDFHYSAPRPEGGKQIVLKWDDARGVVIVEGYVDSMKQPVFVKEWPLPQVVSKSDFVRITAQDAIEQGASYQAF